jgi:hypothetical protein
MGKPHRKSLIKEALDRLDSKMAIGESRQEAKQAARAAAAEQGEHIWSYSTGKMHSYKTRTSYQEHIFRFLNWVRQESGITTLETLDACADEQVSRYLQLEVEAGKKSPYTLQLERSALRLFFDDHTLAASVALPKRTLAGITRSRRPAARDRHFQPANWQPLLKFERATGLRKDELKRILVGDVYCDYQKQLVAHVRCGKGGKEREVPVLPGREPDVLAVTTEREPHEPIFPRLPDTEMHSLRREYAQSLYLHHAPGRDLPPTDRRLRPTDYDLAAVKIVSRALGHERIGVVLRHYLR